MRRLTTAALALALLGSALQACSDDAEPDTTPSGAATSSSQPAEPVSPSTSTAPTDTPSTPARPKGPYDPPGSIFDDGRFLVAYYGSADTGALGVLGETDPATMHRRLTRAAARFERKDQPVQEVFELIVTVADPHPGEDRSFSHDIAKEQVRRYIRAAHRHNALLVLDLQPGRSDFLTVAKRWEWALKDPLVGLALDPEWRMKRGQVPGRVIGSVDADEINEVTRWLVDLQIEHQLPEKLFLLHQFRTDMIERIGMVKRRPSLAMVQHVDGFGTPGQKLDTFHAVARPQKFLMGFKLFYDEDTHLMNSTQVHRIRPKVRFVSFQ